MVEKISERSDIAKVVTKAKATKLIQEGQTVVGVEYTKGGQTLKAMVCILNRKPRQARKPQYLCCCD